MSIQQTITDAAREGARLSIAPASQTTTLPSDNQIRGRVGYFLQSNGISVGGSSGASIAIDRNLAIGTEPDRYTRVSVSYPYRLMSLAMFEVLQVTVRGTARMRNETSP